MPCESCNAQFTVFKRKKSCTECRRLYCNQCLVKRKERVLCDRCVVFTRRPLSKIELLKLKPKDLIFYLQSKHISTTGCVEKEELVNMVMIHVNNSTSYNNSEGSGGSGSARSRHDSGTTTTTTTDENCSNPFDQIKQTCQNLFTTFTDKIASDLNFDLKSPTSSTTATNPSNGGQNIFAQPRASARPPGDSVRVDNSGGASPQSNNSTFSSHSSVPATAAAGGSSSRQQSPAVNELPSAPTSNGGFIETRRRSYRSDQQQQPSTPRRSTKLAAPAPPPSSIPQIHTRKFVPPATTNPTHLDLNAAAANSACECSDDEVIEKFNRSYSSKTTSPINETVNGEAGPSLLVSATVNTTLTTNKTPTADGANSDASSSFEEIVTSNSSNGGGGINATIEQCAGPSDDSSWQIVSKPSSSATRPNVMGSSATFHPQHSNETVSLLHATRRLSRRRSDTAIYENAFDTTRSQCSLNYDENLFAGATGGCSSSNNGRSKTSCDKCGKSKGTLRRHVAKLKRQLEATDASEFEIRQQLDAFLLYLENCNRNSMDDAEDGDDDNDGDDNDDARSGAAAMAGPSNNVTFTYNQNDSGGGGGGSIDPTASLRESYEQFVSFFGDDEGIHVYGSDDINAGCGPARQFINLNDYADSSDLNDLTVKQLKEILMLNRVDFKGCCEKTELLDRVKRLWTEYNASPAIDKLPTDDLCKICMDAPIECVILECGHVATCTSCGKVLNECPICRQYIVRVVRFFRA